VVKPRPDRPGKKFGTHHTWGWLRRRVSIGWVRKFSLPLGFDPRSVRPIASPYIDRAISAPVPEHRNFEKNISKETSFNIQQLQTLTV